MTPMNARGPTDAETWLLSVPPTRRQTRWAIAVAVGQVAALALVAPFARTQLAEINAFIPAFEGVIFVTDLVTSVLLFSQFAIYRLRALLLLACAYLFSALMIIPHALTFPGAFSPTGLLGAGLQTTASLYWFWHLLFPMALLGYGLMRDEKSDPGPAEPSSLVVIVGSVALVVTFVCGLTVLATAGNNYLPVLFADRVGFTPEARLAAATTMLLSVSAVAVLWLRRRSLLDQWLIIVALAALLEMALGAVFVSGRFSLGFYAGRLFSLLTSTIVLVVLLAETTRLYATVARSQEGKIRRLVDANILGICISNLEGAIIEANEAFLRMLQYSREDVVSRRLRWTDLTPAEWREQNERSVAELHSTGAFHPVEKEYFRKDGSRVPVLVGGALFEKSGNEGVIFALDLTERKRAEEALHESERKLRQFIESVPAHFWSVSPDGNATYVNQRLLDYFGIRLADQKASGPEDQRPSDWKAVLHPDDVAETEKALNHAFQTGEPFQCVHRLRRADGEYRWHRVRAEPQRGPEGQIVQWYGLSVDIDERKKAQDQLRRNEAYLAEAERLSHTGGWAVARKGERTIVYWSEESYRIFGRDPRQGMPTRDWVWQQIHPDDRRQLREEADAALREKRDYVAAFRILLPDGTIKYLESNARHLFSADGGLIEVMGTFVDVTERRRAAQALRESEAKFRDFAETASDWFCEMGPDYKFTLLSENAFGSGGADRIGTACWDHALDLETEPEKWRLLRETVFSRKPFRDFVYCGMSSDGSPMYVRASGKPLFDANGEFQGYRGTCTDVTEIMHAQEALRESERSLRSAIDGIPGLVAVLAPNGEVEAVNRQLLEYFDQPLEWIKNWGTNDMVHPEDLPRAVDFFKRAIASGIPFNIEQRLRRFDDEYRSFETRGVPIRDDSGRIARWYVLLTDVDDRTRALARLDQMQSDLAHMNRVSMMGELAASLSHEILHPIAAARNNARAGMRFLEMNPPNLNEAREALGCVVRDADRAKDIVGRIRNQIKRAPPRKMRFGLNEAVNEVIVMVQSAITKSGISCSTRLMDGLVPVQGDRVQLQQVLVNLILNAVEAMSSIEDGARELSIRTEQSQTGGILVAVHDSGPGVDPVNLERVFEPFYTTKTSGIGMGLSICETIINGHGGRLWMSANEPRGAVFQFTLPAVQENS
jgi:PAS domain S-box-containing protein